MLLDDRIREPRCCASVGERLRLLARPPVARVAARARVRAAFDGDQAAGRLQHPLRFAQPRVDVLPVVDGRDRPHDGRGTVFERQ